ncbi:putative cytochrome c oxidase copper chaperone [Ochromonadaceae sp. CCMP2298]|nr:putative cytochrome c oxidase copper chaperone [Ochromonadaceae sp. CCMP2298]
MGQGASAPQPNPKASPQPQGPQVGKLSGKKICCSCPDTKVPRDECIVTNGEENCKDLIEAHKACLRLEGFTVK